MPNGINGINLLSPSIRDYLLNRNLILSDTITNNGLGGLAVGLGFPVNISSTLTTVVPSSDILIDGPIYRDLNTINNPYGTNNPILVDINTNNVQFIGNLPIGTPQSEYPAIVGSRVINSDFTIASDNARNQLLFNRYQANEGDQVLINLNTNTLNYNNAGGGYVDSGRNLNIGGNPTDGLNVIGSLLNGGGIGIGGNTNFDIRSTLAGRVLGSTGGINDTPLGIIGGQQLLLALSNKAAFNAQRELLGQLNLNPLSLISGNDVLVPNYSITVGTDTGKKVLDIGLNILGIENPLGIFEQGSSIFYRENPVDTKTRIESQLLNTGAGQINNLFVNLNANKYRLGVSDGRENEKETVSNLYIFDDGNGGMVNMLDDIPVIDDNGNFLGTIEGSINNPISPSNFNLNKMVRDANFPTLNGIKFGDEGFTWAHNSSSAGDMEFLPTMIDGNVSSSIYENDYANLKFDKKSLLGKTKDLFKNNKMTVMVSRRGLEITDATETDNTVKVGNSNYISRGSGVKSGKAIEGSVSDANEVFCRSWTSVYKYNQVQNLQKSEGLGVEFGLRNRNTVSSSVLDDNGFVRIGPYKGDANSSDSTPSNMRRFMFSLENLAWHGQTGNLPANEIGPGDPFTGTKGRIMWFPPYDLKFSEDSSLNWDTHEFIGRGEPLYTYNNTERSGTLSFKVLMDHPSYINDMRSSAISNDLFASIAAGCADFDLATIKNLTKNESDRIEVANSNNTPKVKDIEEIAPNPFTIYFPNDVFKFRPDTIDYENGDGIGLDKIKDDDITPGITVYYDDKNDFGLNKEYLDPNFFPQLKKKLMEQCPSCKINLDGYASRDGITAKNQILSDNRAKSVKDLLVEKLFGTNDDALGVRFGYEKGNGEVGCPKGDGVVYVKCKKEARKVIVSFKPDPKIKEVLINAEIKKIEAKRKLDLTNEIKSRFFNEAMYFDKLKQEDKLTYDSIGEKIKFFHPAFHSITPEGFNSRLNFLQQCTRQGPSIQSDSPSNLAFGMAPVCILRVGDFYHTKIIIENIGINYDVGNGVQWDLNPEGVGVQPMIADVTMSFKFIGGSSLDGPINKLQNAVSFNFFANTEVYDPRADYIKVNTDTDTGAEYINDNIVFSDLVDSSSVEGLNNDNETTINQLAQAEVSNSNTQNNEVSPASIEPEILGFDYVEVNGWPDSLYAHSINIKLKSKNIVANGSIIDEEAATKFLAKGLRLTLTKPNSGIVTEELIKTTTSSPQGLKSLLNSVDLFYELGTFSDKGTVVENISAGNYELTVSYNGRRIQTVLIAVGSEPRFKATY